MNKYYLYTTVFITGAVILILEILGTRIIAPYYGTTLYVWSSLITVTLVALALGYFIGGKLADKKPESNVMYLIIFFAGLSILLIPLISSFVLTKTNSLGQMWGALTSTTILFTLPLFLLGMIVPYAIKLKAKDLEKIGITVGSLYAVATIGSFVGAILTGFFLIPNFGIKSIIYLISGSLFLVSIIWFFIQKKKIIQKKKMLIIIAITIPILILQFNFSIPYNSRAVDHDVKVIYQVESAYARLKVLEEYNIYRYLIVDGSTHTQYNMRDDKFMFHYLELFEKAVKYHSNPKDVLVIGLGGGGTSKVFSKYNLNVDTVEIDQKVLEIAKEFFNFNDSIIIDDGRHYIKTTNKKYDIVFLDVYNGYSIYPYLFSKEAFEEIKNILNENGILVINSMGYENGHLSSDDKLILSIYKTLKEVFPNIYVKSTSYGLTSFVFYASDSTLSPDRYYLTINIVPKNDTKILTDDYNPIDTFTLELIEESRNADIKRFGYDISI